MVKLSAALLAMKEVNGLFYPAEFELFLLTNLLKNR